MEKEELKKVIFKAFGNCLLNCPENISDEMSMLEEIADDEMDILAILIEMEHELGVDLTDEGLTSGRVTEMNFGQFVDEVFRIVQ